MPINPQIPFKTTQRIQSQLQSGEGIRWIGQPNPRTMVIASIGIFLFGIFWTGFAIFWVCGASGFKIPDFKNGFSFFPLFGIPFVLIGFGMLLSPLISYCKAKMTYYVVTDRRALIFDDARETHIQSFGPDKLQEIERIELPNGTGNIMFGYTMSTDLINTNRPVKVGFIGIPNVRSVETLISEITKRA